MKWIAALVAIVFGIGAGELLVRLPLVHQMGGRVCGRGDLVALVGSRGIFSSDVKRKGEQNPARDSVVVQDEVIATETLRQQIGAASATLRPFEDEFGDEKKLQAALRENHLGENDLRKLAGLATEGDRWIETQLPPPPREDEIVAWFQQHENAFALPLRIRARHVFLAAPDGSAPELVEAKQKAVEEVMKRLKRGEDFAQMAAIVSEDEATKNNGGDLGFFAANRVPPEFFSAVEKLRLNGEVSLVRSHLGFHAVQVTEIQPARAMAFVEVRGEIRDRLAATKRSAAVTALAQQLAPKQ